VNRTPVSAKVIVARDNREINMFGCGMVASAGALIYLAGEKKTRFCLPNTRFLLHQPLAISTSGRNLRPVKSFTHQIIGIVVYGGLPPGG
jgi:Clp protease